MTEEQARERLRQYIRQHYGTLKPASSMLNVSIPHLSMMLSGRKRLNDRILMLIGLRRVEKLEAVE